MSRKENEPPPTVPDRCYDVLEWLDQQPPREERAKIGPDVYSTTPYQAGVLKDLPGFDPVTAEDMLRVLDDAGFIEVHYWSTYTIPVGPRQGQQDRAPSPWYSPRRRSTSLQWSQLFQRMSTATQTTTGTSGSSQQALLLDEGILHVRMTRKGQTALSRWRLAEKGRLDGPAGRRSGHAETATSDPFIPNTPTPCDPPAVATPRVGEAKCSGFLSATDLAARNCISPHKLRTFQKALERWRKTNVASSDFLEHDAPQANSPRFHYREGAVVHIIRKYQ